MLIYDFTVFSILFYYLTWPCDNKAVSNHYFLLTFFSIFGLTAYTSQLNFYSLFLFIQFDLIECIYLYRWLIFCSVWVFGCDFYWCIGKQHNFERGKNYVKCTYRLDGRAGQVNFWLEVIPVLIIRSGPTKLSQWTFYHLVLKISKFLSQPS